MTGLDRLDFLHRMSTSSVVGLRPGHGLATVLTTDIGRVVDRVEVYCRADSLLLLTSAGRSANVAQHLARYVLYRDKVRVSNVQSQVGTYTLLGEGVPRLLAGIAPVGAELSQGRIVETLLDSHELWIMRQPSPSLDGYHLMVPRAAVPAVEGTLSAAGAAVMESETHDRLRIEAGLPAYGSEFDERTNPLEAGLRRLVNFDKGCYIGQEVIARLDTYQKVQRVLVRLEFPMIETAPGAKLLVDGRPAGQLTSVATGAVSTLALGYLSTRYWRGVGEVAVETNGGPTRASQVSEV